MSKITTYLRLIMAFTLVAVIGGTSVATAFAGPIGPGAPAPAMLQDDDGGDDDADDGTGGDDIAGDLNVSAAFDPEPRPTHIHVGSCDDLGDDVAELNSLVAPDGAPIGSDGRERTEYAYTPQIPLSMDQMTDDDHVIVVELSELNDSVIACGAIGGVRDANGSLVVNLTSDDDDDDDVYGVAVLTPSASNSGATAASIFISGSSLGDDIGSRVDDDDRDHDNDGRNDDDADDDGIRDDDDDDDDGRLDDDDDDDDGDGRTDDDDDDDGGSDDDGVVGGGGTDDGGEFDDGTTDDGGGFVGDGGTDDGGQFDDGTTDDGGVGGGGGSDDGGVGGGGSGGSGGGGGSGGS